LFPEDHPGPQGIDYVHHEDAINACTAKWLENSASTFMPANYLMPHFAENLDADLVAVDEHQCETIVMQHEIHRVQMRIDLMA
jgi:hypothetical protein